jgi:four helix bundle protein
MIEVSNVYPEPRLSVGIALREDPPKHSEGRRYDLAERTAAFAEKIVTFARKLPEDAVTRPLISQVVRSGGSIGANYCEADDAVSKKEFRQKIGTCRKESKETKYWIRVIVAAVPSVREEARPLAGGKGVTSDFLRHTSKILNCCVIE